MILKFLKGLFTSFKKEVIEPIEEEIAKKESLPTSMYNGQSTCKMCDTKENPYHISMQHGVYFSIVGGRALIRRVCYRCGFSWYEWPRDHK